MRSPSLASKLDYLVCPLCETGKLHASAQSSMRCQSCGGSLSMAVLETIRQITVLPDTLGNHACECGHPEMRYLPDGTYHCPACGSEVLPVDATLTPPKSSEHSEAYLAGWIDGHFGKKDSVVDNPNLAKWESPSDRLDYYRGHRAGSELRGLASRLAPVLPRSKG